MSTDVQSGTAQVTIGGSIPIDPADGAAHLFVDPVNGDDENVGLTAATAFQTINRAVERMNAWLALELDLDLVIELANGTYAEDVQFIMAQIPVRRVFLRGDSTAMTVLASGTLTAATAYLVTDAGAAFGATNQFAGQIIEVFDPASPATTLQQKTLRSHTGTAIAPVAPFSPIPVAGWSYRILEPAAVIVGQGSGAFASNPAMRIVLPWDTTYDGNVQYPGTGPMLGLMFIKVTSAPSTFGIDQIGGAIFYTGVFFDGDGALLVTAGTAVFQGGFIGIVDPIYGTSLTYSPNESAGIGSRVASIFFGIRIDHGSSGLGFIVSVGTDIFTLGARLIWEGGAIHGGGLEAIEQSEISIFALDPLLPVLFMASPTNAVIIREGSRAECSEIVFDDCLSNAFSIDSTAWIRVSANITAGAGDVAGVGIWCQNGAKAQVGSAVTFTTTGPNLRVGNGVDADGDSTFAALTLTAPLIDHPNDNGRGAMGVQPGSLASIWEV
ncbi:MAG: hypothetical protein ACRD1X_17880 [Vicinamibacteria bacterium]